MRETIISRRQRNAGPALAIAAIIRRLVVKATASVNRWSMAGHRDDEGNEEGFDDVPVYQQVGFVSRPKAGTGKTKAILVAVGGSARAVAVVASDDPTGKPALEPDESAIFNSLVRVICTDDGKVLVDDGGGAVELALKSDVAAAKATFDAHTHLLTLSSGTGTAAVPATPMPAPAGTTILKAK